MIGFAQTGPCSQASSPGFPSSPPANRCRRLCLWRNVRVPTARRCRENTQSLKTYSNAIATHPLDRYVWALEYVDAPIIRYRDGNVNGELDDAGDSSLYYLHDANFNVTGLVDRAETAVVERYMYEPYGRATVLNGADDADEGVNDWSVDSDPDASDWSNEILYCGYRRDAESALYHVRHRYYHPTLGRWVSRDPVGYVEGYNLYGYVADDPVGYVDPYGLGFLKWCRLLAKWCKLIHDGPEKAMEPTSPFDPMRLLNDILWKDFVDAPVEITLKFKPGSKSICATWFRNSFEQIKRAANGQDAQCSEITRSNAHDLCMDELTDLPSALPGGYRLWFFRVANAAEDNCTQLERQNCTTQPTTK